MATKDKKQVGPKPTWTNPKDLLNDFENFLKEQRPHKITELKNVRRIRPDREHIKRPQSSDYEWTVEEVETLSQQGRITIVAFAAWKRVHKTTITTGYSEGIFKDVYQTILGICEDYSEDQLYKAERNANAIIFAMKNNYNWVDKTETEFSGNLDPHLSPEAQAVLDKALRGGEEDVTSQ